MTAGTGLVQRWEIVAQRGGEVSATREQAPGLELWLLGVPRGTTEAEVRGWLHDVAGVAVEASQGPRGAQPIPALLHHALTGLLFSHAEVWERPGQPAPCSVVFTGEDDEIGFGWIGAAQVELTIDGEPAPSRWVLVRDSTGREAHAFRAPADRDVTMRLTWLPSPLDPDSAMVEIEAHWAGGTGASIAERRARAAAEARAARDAAASGSAMVDAEPGAVDEPAHAGLVPEEAHEVGEPATVVTPESAIPTGPEGIASMEPPDLTAIPAEEDARSESISPEGREAEPSRPYEPITGHDEFSGLPPGRPSTGIARWLHKNFAWLGQGHGHENEPATLPVPPVSDPSEIAARLEREAALAGERAMAPPASESDLAAPAPESSEIAASENAVPETTFEPTPDVVRSLEDELAASAAALAAALGGDRREGDADTSQDPPWWRETSDASEPESFEPLPGRSDASEPELPESLPEAIPPTPEPPELSARAITPPVVEPVRPVPSAPVPPAPVLSRPTAPPPSVSTRPPRPETPTTPTTPPRMDVPARLMLRRPREATPDDAHEIHSRALGAREEAPAEPAPLVIERVGAERPVVIPPEVAPGTGSAGGDVSGQGPGETRVIPAADPSEWVSRFIKRPPPTGEPEPSAPAPGDESAWLESVRRDEWRELHRAEGAPEAASPAARPVEAAAPAHMVERHEPETAAFEPEAAPEPDHDAGEMREPVEPADAEPPPRPRIAPVQHPAWPEASELEGERRLDRRWLWAAGVVAVLFGVGWLLGAVQWPVARPGETRRGPLAAVLQTLGFHGPHYQVSLSSRPDAASIQVDGRDLQQRTPATIELSPGAHVVTLSFGQWGEVRYPVDGKKGDHVNIDGTLWGSLQMVSPEPGTVVAISIDERPRGFAPLTVDSLAPGPHQVRFSGPGMASWSQTVEVKVGETVQVLTRALSSPSTGLLQIRAMTHVDGEATEAKGAKVFLDGHAHGVTPQSVELPRGPHSVRVEWQGGSSAVQMIDLPGGNQRFATFDFGGGVEPPHFKLDAPERFSEAEPVVISVTVDGLGTGEVREMWLHVRGPEGTWERYPMSRLDSRTAAVGALTFPIGAFDAQGTTQWYASIVSAQGDEYFTELQDAQLEKRKR